MESRRSLLLVLSVVAAVLVHAAQSQEQQVEQCPCGDPNLAFCLPKGGVLLQRLAATTPLCEAQDQPCAEGLIRVCLKNAPTAAPAAQA